MSLKFSVNPKKNQTRISARSRYFQLAAKLRDVDAMLGRFVGTDENYRDVPSITFLQNGVFVDVHFAKGGAKFAD